MNHRDTEAQRRQKVEKQNKLRLQADSVAPVFSLCLCASVVHFFR
jgi:hypothetical protein